MLLEMLYLRHNDFVISVMLIIYCTVDVLVQLLDKEDYQSGIEEIIDSIQYKKLNK